MKVMGLLLLVCVVAGCATLSEEELGLAREFDEYMSEIGPDTDAMKTTRSACILTGYVVLSAKERSHMKDSQTLQDLDMDFLGADDIKSFRECLTTNDIWFVKRGGLGFDPKDLDEIQTEFDPAQLTARQKAVVMKIINDILSVLEGLGFSPS